MDSVVARQMWQACEPYHAVTYFAPESRASTDALGLKGGWMSYFACRAAPMGPVPAEVVIATFYNFAPAMVRRSIPDAWHLASVDDILAARLAAADIALRRLIDADAADVAEAAVLARTAAEAASPVGRALFAANAALPWPAQPHLALWSAITRLREYRGDGHVATLLANGLDPLEAHVTMAATRGVPAELMQSFRQWSAEDWAAAVGRLQKRGWLGADGTLTAEGVRGREEVEQRTDELALPAWQALGAGGVLRLVAIMRELSDQIVGQGGLMQPNPMGLTWPPEWHELTIPA